MGGVWEGVGYGKGCSHPSRVLRNLKNAITVYEMTSSVDSALCFRCCNRKVHNVD